MTSAEIIKNLINAPVLKEVPVTHIVLVALELTALLLDAEEDDNV